MGAAVAGRAWLFLQREGGEKYSTPTNNFIGFADIERFSGMFATIPLGKPSLYIVVEPNIVWYFRLAAGKNSGYSDFYTSVLFIMYLTVMVSVSRMYV